MNTSYLVYALLNVCHTIRWCCWFFSFHFIFSLLWNVHFARRSISFATRHFIKLFYVVCLFVCFFSLSLSFFPFSVYIFSAYSPDCHELLIFFLLLSFFLDHKAQQNGFIRTNCSEFIQTGVLDHPITQERWSRLK